MNEHTNTVSLGLFSFLSLGKADSALPPLPTSPQNLKTSKAMTMRLSE